MSFPTSVPALIQNILNRVKARVRRDDHDGVADLDGILTAGDDDGTVAVDEGDEKSFLQIQIHQRRVCDFGLILYAEFDRLHAVVEHMVERFDIAVHGVLLRAHVGDDCLRGDELGIDDASQIQTVYHVVKGDAVDLRDDFGFRYHFGMERQKDIDFVDSRERNEGFRVLDSLFFQKFLVGAVAVDDDGFRQKNAQLLAAPLIALDDLDGDAHMQQQGSEVVCGFAAADNHGIFDGVGLETDLFEESFGDGAGCHKGDQISLVQAEDAGRDMDIALALHGADQDVVRDISADRPAEIHDHHAVQQIPLGNFEFDHLRLAVGECAHFQRRRQIEDAGRFAGCLQLRIDDHGKAEFFAQIVDLFAVVRCADSGDSGTVADTLGHRAAQKVQLVGVRHGNDQVGVLDAGFHLHAVAGAVADDPHDVVQIGQFLDFLGVCVDQSDVVPLFGQLGDERLPDLAAADNDDFQSLLGGIFQLKHLCISPFRRAAERRVIGGFCQVGRMQL